MRPFPWLSACLLGAAVAAAALVRSDPTARQIVDAARRAHGAAILDTTALAFTFRGTDYYVERLGGPRTVARALPDSVGEGCTIEMLDPDGAVMTWRYATGMPPFGPDTLRGSEAARVASSIASVVYFALLPHGLADASVRLRRLPDDVLGGRPVRTVEVTFDSTGGGRSWRDRYVYWIDARRATVDAFAYDYEDGDGETRLRLATRVQAIGARGGRGTVRMQDYATYTDPAMKGRIEGYLSRIGTPTLRKVSDVALDSVRLGPITGSRFWRRCVTGPSPMRPRRSAP